MSTRKKRLDLVLEACVSCPYSVPAPDPDFEVKDEDLTGDGVHLKPSEQLEAATGLWCLNSDRWIGGENRIFLGPIPDWCLLDDAK